MININYTDIGENIVKKKNFRHDLKMDLRLIRSMENNVLLIGCGEIGSPEKIF